MVKGDSMKIKFGKKTILGEKDDSSGDKKFDFPGSQPTGQSKQPAAGPGQQMPMNKGPQGKQGFRPSAFPGKSKPMQGKPSSGSNPLFGRKMPQQPGSRPQMPGHKPMPPGARPGPRPGPRPMPMGRSMPRGPMPQRPGPNVHGQIPNPFAGEKKPKKSDNIIDNIANLPKDELAAYTSILVGMILILVSVIMMI